MSRMLLTGMSGTGKSSALKELGRRGYRVVDTDDPGWREYCAYVESNDEVSRGEWLWLEERITELLDSDEGDSLFVQGCVWNQSKFYDRFDAIVLLSAPADVILDRIARRTTNSYGKTPVERATVGRSSTSASAVGMSPRAPTATMRPPSARIAVAGDQLSGVDVQQPMRAYHEGTHGNGTHSHCAFVGKRGRVPAETAVDEPYSLCRT